MFFFFFFFGKYFTRENHTKLHPISATGVAYTNDDIDDVIPVFGPLKQLPFLKVEIGQGRQK